LNSTANIEWAKVMQSRSNADY